MKAGLETLGSNSRRGRLMITFRYAYVATIVVFVSVLSHGAFCEEWPAYRADAGALRCYDRIVDIPPRRRLDVLTAASSASLAGGREQCVGHQRSLRQTP